MNIDDLTIGEAKQLAAIFNQSNIAQSGTSVPATTPHPMVGKHCVVRSSAEGVHIGTVTAAQGTECLLTNARRLWNWQGAFTLSEVATDGVDPKSRMAVEVSEVYLTQAISFIPTTEKARATYEKCSAK